MPDKLKVLVLDDERLVRFTIAAYLTGAGFAVTEVATPEEAVGLIKRERFHAIVSDVMMGETDGFMFRSLVREVDAQVPIVFLTSMLNDAGNAFIERVTEDVRSYYVPKSASRALLVSRLNQVVQAHVAELNVARMERTLTRDLRLASLVQKAMLPPWVHLAPRYSYTSCFAPFQEVSGDFYEWFPITEDTALFIGGDISGHGTGASLAQTAVQAFIKQFAALDDLHAARVHKVAQRIHEFICANLHDVVYLVATVVYFDFGSRTGLYLNCGNPDLKCFSRKTGARRRLNPENLGCLPLGLLPDATYAETDVVPFAFAEDEVFVAHSDGVYDVSRDFGGADVVPMDIVGEIVSMAVLQAEQERRHGLFSAIPHRIMSALADLGYVHKQDDVSFFVIGAGRRSPDILQLEVNMRPDVIDAVSRQAAAWVKARSDDETGVRADLLLNEHLLNVYRHGLDDFGRQHERAVVFVGAEPDGFDVTVWDRGAPWKDVASETEAEADASLDAQNARLAGGGRGRSIVRKVTDSIRVERFMNLNKTIFRLKRAEGARAVRTSDHPTSCA